MLSDVHKSFLDAGSDAITTNSYGVTPGVGFSEAEITKHVATAGKIARDVANAYSTQKLVLGSLGPLVESYRPDLILDPPEKGVKMYTTVAETLSPYVDVFIAETMSCVKESSQAIKAVGRLNKDNRCPMIVSYTLDSDGNLRDGDPATNAVEKTLAMSRENNVECKHLFYTG